MNEILIGTLGDFLALLAILIGIVFGMYFIVQWICEAIKRLKMKGNKMYPKNGTEARILNFVGEMLTYQSELEIKHQYETNPSKKGLYANELMSLSEWFELQKEYGYWKPGKEE